jgi:hypothetical protein
VWTNFNQLLSLITKFVFQTAHWRSEIAKRDPNALPVSPTHAGMTSEEKVAAVAAEAKSSHQNFILSKARIGSSAAVVLFNESQEFGVHFTETQGKAGDIKLLQTLLSFFDMLHLDKFDAVRYPMIMSCDGMACSSNKLFGVDNEIGCIVQFG